MLFEYWLRRVIGICWFNKYLLHIQQKEANMKPKRKLLTFKMFCAQRMKQKKADSEPVISVIDSGTTNAKAPNEIHAGTLLSIEHTAK